MPDTLRASRPVVLLTGFLGAGKTTLLQRILSAPDSPRTAVLVNDFGAINIDAELIAEVSGDGLVALQNGCICCTIRDDLVGALRQVLDQTPPPERVVIEASGVSRPLQILGALEDPGLQDLLHLEGVFCLVDCENFLDLDFARSELAMDQIGSSDIALLNKADLVPAATVEAIRTRLAGLHPRLRLVQTVATDLPAALMQSLFAWGDGAPLSAEALARASAPQAEEHGHHHDHGHGHGQPHDHGHDHAEGHDFTAWAGETRLSLDPARLRRALQGLPAGVLRGKGIVRDGQGRRLTFDLVGKRITLAPGKAAGPEVGHLAFIHVTGTASPADFAALLEAASDLEADPVKAGR